MNNNQPGMNRNQNPFNNLPPALRPKNTNTSLKFLLALILGVLPMLMCILFIGLGGPDSGSVNWSDFNQWGTSAQNKAWIVSYGIMWLIGISVYIAIIIIVVILTKFVEDINLDVLPLISGLSLAMFNMFIIPHFSPWFLLISVPAFMIIGYVIGAIVSVSIALSIMQKEMSKNSDNPNSAFKQMQEQMRANNPNLANKPKPTNKKKTKYKDNPFVDLKEDEDDEDESD